MGIQVNGAQDKPTNMTDFIHPHDTDMDKENKSLQIIPLTAGTRKHNIPWGILFQCSKNDQETMTDNEHVSVPYIDHKAKETRQQSIYVTHTEKQESKDGTTYICYTLKTQWNDLYLPYIAWYVTSTQYPTHWRRSETIYIYHTLSGTPPLLNILHIKDSVKQSIFTIHCIVHHL